MQDAVTRGQHGVRDAASADPAEMLDPISEGVKRRKTDMGIYIFQNK